MEIIIGLSAALCGLIIGYAMRAAFGRWQADSVEKQAQEKLNEAEAEVKRRMREADIQARTEVVQARETFEQSAKLRRQELQDFDARLVQREENLERKLAILDEKTGQNDAAKMELAKFAEHLHCRENDLKEKLSNADNYLQQLAGMTREEARLKLRKKVEDSVRAEMGGLLRRLHEEAKENALRDAQSLIANAVERYAAVHTADNMTTTVILPSDEIKGRLIGREGRNIKAVEAATGLSLIVDCTPDTVLISGFNPIRREIARRALESLISDGRISPKRIEEAVSQATDSMDEVITQAGKEAAYEAKLLNLAPEIIEHLGRLKFRSSYSQNVLAHSLEVSRLMGSMAAEMRLDAALARRIGLLHDIGKSVSQEIEGGHAKLGADILRKANEDPILINAVEAHHEDVEKESVYAALCAAADTISSARPGARNETSEIYVERMTKLEKIASSRVGVKSAYAFQAGRELRILVDPDKLNDNDAMILAHNICRSIETEMRYPGRIRVVVIRERKCVEYAH